MIYSSMDYGWMDDGSCTTETEEHRMQQLGADGSRIEQNGRTWLVQPSRGRPQAGRGHWDRAAGPQGRSRPRRGRGGELAIDGRGARYGNWRAYKPSAA